MQIVEYLLPDWIFYGFQTLVVEIDFSLKHHQNGGFSLSLVLWSFVKPKTAPTHQEKKNTMHTVTSDGLLIPQTKIHQLVSPLTYCEWYDINEIYGGR